MLEVRDGRNLISVSYKSFVLVAVAKSNLKVNSTGIADIVVDYSAGTVGNKGVADFGLAGRSCCEVAEKLDLGDSNLGRIVDILGNDLSLEGVAFYKVNNRNIEDDTGCTCIES